MLRCLAGFFQEVGEGAEFVVCEVAKEGAVEGVDG